mmetsp:Transcript_11154/g.33160  ORF Transcript_11154/g.33160 Transcript_11154/m.33160 type:complete len:505 (-) Transcript_11154:344-1858(-)
MLVVDAADLVKLCKRRRAQRRASTAVPLEEVWQCMLNWITFQLGRCNGVAVPHLCTLTWRTHGLRSAGARNTFPASGTTPGGRYRPVCIFHERFLQDAGLKSRALTAAGVRATELCKTEPLNSTRLALNFSANLTKDQVFSGVRELVACIFALSTSEAEVAIDMAGVGMIVVSNRHAAFEFAPAYLPPGERTAAMERLADIRRNAVLTNDPLFNRHADVDSAGLYVGAVNKSRARQDRAQAGTPLERMQAPSREPLGALVQGSARVGLGSVRRPGSAARVRVVHQSLKPEPLRGGDLLVGTVPRMVGGCAHEVVATAGGATSRQRPGTTAKVAVLERTLSTSARPRTARLGPGSGASDSSALHRRPLTAGQARLPRADTGPSGDTGRGRAGTGGRGGGGDAFTVQPPLQASPRPPPVVLPPPEGRAEDDDLHDLGISPVSRIAPGEGAKHTPPASPVFTLIARDLSPGRVPRALDLGAADDMVRSNRNLSPGGAHRISDWLSKP